MAGPRACAGANARIPSAPARPSRRERRTSCGATGAAGTAPSLSLPRMGLGTWAWGNRLLWGYDESMDAELERVFQYCVSQGCHFFDTGDSYGTGKLNARSESLLGEFRSKLPDKDDRDRVVVGTKLAAYPWRLSRGSMVDACSASASRLGCDRIELAQLHWSASNYAPWQERALWDGLGDMAERGLAGAVGVSNYGPEQLVRIHSHLASRGVRLATCQVQFSLLSYGDAQRETQAVCDDLGIEVIAYSPLALGLLTGKYDVRDKSSLPPGLRGLAFRSLLPGIRPLLSAMAAVGAEVGATDAQVALAWCLAKGTVPIPGAKTVDQATQNVGALRVNLGEAHCHALEQAAQSCESAMVQNIFMTA